MSTIQSGRALVAALASAVTLAATLSVMGLVADPPPAQGATMAPVTVTGLTVNGRTNPLGIPGEAPSFGWHGESDVRGVVQTAYEIQVATSESALSTPDVWDSHRRTSSRQVDVLYAGPVLKSQTRYWWKVRTWDGAGRMSAWSDAAWFETGMLSMADWGGARWIGAAPHVEADRWHDYTADFSFSLDEGGFGAIFGDYLWQISVADGTPRFRPHLKAFGRYSVLESKDISSVISVADLMRGVHTLSITISGGTVSTRLDGKHIDTRTPDPRPGNVVRGFVGVRTAAGEDATVHSVKVGANTGRTLLTTDFAENNPFGTGEIDSAGLELEGEREGVWRPDDRAMPLLRTEFASAKTLTRARVYATARGVYQMSLNGQPVGDQHLAPGWTDYHQRIQHQTYDVTGLVRQGDNAWGVELGRGWWAGKVGPLAPGRYGTDLSFLARLRLDYSDGTTRWVDTNDTTWVTRPGPYTATDNMDGESYDARLEQPGFDRPGFDDSGWYPVVVGSDDASSVVAQPDEPVRTTQTLPARRRTNPSPGKYVYDLGQNIVGVARMVLHGKAGSTATIRYGEALNPDGTLYTANLRKAKATDTYTFDADGTATYEPAFTQHGFQYVEISGTDTPPTLGEVTGVVWGSDLTAIGNLQTSDPMLNQLLSNISWGQRDNFLSIPTDTPARDERLGWSGDISLFAPTASYLRDTRAFLGKWVTDLVDAQEPWGDFTAYAPVPPGYKQGAGAGWADAGITVPYALWQAYGDATVLRDNWEEISKFFAFVRTWPNASLIEDRRPRWGDWLNLDDSVSNGIIGTAYFAQDARMMSEMAAALGKTSEAAEFGSLFQDVRRAFAAAYIAADGTVKGNTQTGYAMALGMGLVPDELKAKVGEKYVAKIEASGNHLTTGFLGTPLLLPALSEVGRDDVAWKLLMRTEYPSWGYEVLKGATTMWERWDTVKPDGSFGDVGMNSFNHYAYGAVGDWMYRNIGAIAPAAPGYKKIRIEPRPGGGVNHAEGTFESVYGTIHTDWTSTSETYRVEGRSWVPGTKLTLAVDVPVNTTAEIVLPGQSTAWVREGGAVLSQVPGVQAISAGGGKVRVTVGSGSYQFTSTGWNLSLGAPLEQALQLRRDVAALVSAGTLAGSDGAALDGLLAVLVEAVQTAFATEAGGTSAAVDLRVAIRSVRDVRTRLEASALGSSGAWSAVSALDDRLAALEEMLSDLTSFYWPVSVSLEALPHLVPGAVVDARVVVDNGSYSPVNLVSGSVRVGNGSIVPFSVATARGNGTTRVPITLRIPDDAAPGRYDAEVTMSYTAGSRTYDLTDIAPITVDSGLQIGSITVQPGTGDPIGRATLKVPVTNTSTVAQSVRGEVGGLSASFKTVASPRISVSPGGSATVSIPLVVAYDRDGTARLQGTVALKRSFTATTLASKDFSLPLPLQAAPPPGAALDYVDFGNATSEAAHQVAGSSSSGTDTLAGLTRRYSHISYPGSWFSADLKVTAGQPFVLRNREVFAAAERRSYDVYVDGIRLKTVTTVGIGSAPNSTFYDVLVDTPAIRAASQDGVVRVKYLFPAGSPGDPSLADSWVLPVPADTLPPLVAATVTDGVEGTNGWYRSDVTMRFEAVDNGDRTPSLWVQQTPELSDTPELAPVHTGLGGDGTHVRYFWGSNGNQNFTPPGAIVVRIDATAPVTQLTDERTATQATLRFTATDPTSGVAQTLYRIDGGVWQVLGTSPVVVTGTGQHTVEYTSTDRAGNHEVTRKTTITVAGP